MKRVYNVLGVQVFGWSRDCHYCYKYTNVQAKRTNWNMHCWPYWTSVRWDIFLFTNFIKLYRLGINNWFFFKLINVCIQYLFRSLVQRVEPEPINRRTDSTKKKNVTKTNIDPQNTIQKTKESETINGTVSWLVVVV